MEQLLRVFRQSSVDSQEPHQLYPPAAASGPQLSLMNAVIPACALPIAGQWRQCSCQPMCGLRNTGKIKSLENRSHALLKNSAINDLVRKLTRREPRYVEMMEMLIDKLAEDESK
ncbi:hypothetical protein ACP70R_046251 [Stipagrostis hirtigluma subsp. patula]